MSNMKSELTSRLRSQLESRGVRLNSADLTAVLEEISPKASHVALGYALNLIRPFAAGMGLRVSRLSDFQVEVVIPSRLRNRNENQQIHEGAVLAAALEGARLLWERHAPLGEFEMHSRKIQMDFFKKDSEDLRLRLELSETLRESILAELRTRRESASDMTAQIYDKNDQLVAEVQMQLGLTHTPSLGSSKN